MTTCGALFGWAVENGFLKHTPTFKLKAPKCQELPTWTEADLVLALEHLPGRLYRAVLLALYTGQRRSDIIRMRWADYDGTSLALVQQKTKEPLVIPCHPDLKAALDMWRQDNVVALNGTILLNAGGKPWKGNSLSAWLSYELAKIPGFPKNLHGLRKLAAVRLAHAGCTLHEIASITGHKSLQMLQLYTKAVDQERLATGAILRLSEKIGKDAKTR